MDQLGDITRTALVLNLVVTGTLIVLAYLSSQHLVALFITDPEVVALSETLLHVVLWSILFFGWRVIFSGIMRASGTSMRRWRSRWPAFSVSNCPAQSGSARPALA